MRVTATTSFKPMDAGIQFGIGTQFRISKNCSLFFDARYSAGQVNLLDSKEFYSRSFRLFGGITFSGG